jgi:hypothetical protein
MSKYRIRRKAPACRLWTKLDKAIRILK